MIFCMPVYFGLSRYMTCSIAKVISLHFQKENTIKVVASTSSKRVLVKTTFGRYNSVNSNWPSMAQYQIDSC